MDACAGEVMWFGLARCVWLFVRMSAVVSMSMNQSSNFEESCPWNARISWRMDVARLDSLCVMNGISMYASMVLCTGSTLNWRADGNRSIMVRCCILSVSCDSSSVGVDWGELDFKLANWFLSCWNYSSKSAKGWQVSVSSHYSLDELLSPSGIVCSWSVRSRGQVLGMRDILCIMVSISSCHTMCLAACS